MFSAMVTAALEQWPFNPWRKHQKGWGMRGCWLLEESPRWSRRWRIPQLEETPNSNFLHPDLKSCSLIRNPRNNKCQFLTLYFVLPAFLLLTLLPPSFRKRKSKNVLCYQTGHVFVNHVDHSLGSLEVIAQMEFGVQCMYKESPPGRERRQNLAERNWNVMQAEKLWPTGWKTLELILLNVLCQAQWLDPKLRLLWEGVTLMDTFSASIT